MDNKNELEKIKEEILDKMSSEKNEKNKMSWSSKTVTVILVVLTIVSIAQAVQSASIMSKINQGATSQSTSGGSAPLPDNLQNLPDMVGGC